MTNTEVCKALAGLQSYAHISREEMCGDNLLVVGAGVDCATPSSFELIARKPFLLVLPD